jgi:membrane protease YdiL (CAAX protease family)
LTFGLTGLLDLALWLVGGLSSPAAGIVTNLQMLVPAFSAIVLSMFTFRDSRIYSRSHSERPRWFFIFFLIFTGVYAALAAVAIISPEQSNLLATMGTGLSLVGLLFLLFLRLAAGRESMTHVGLAGGPWVAWLVGGAGLIAFYAIEMLLNHVFDLGQPVDLTSLAAQVGQQLNVLLIVSTALTLLVNPFLGLMVAFGEEYGWRGTLQTALVKMGKIRGILLLGIIWGLWHAPVIAMGHNFPGRPVLGIPLMTIYSTLLAFVLGYAVLKTGNVLFAAFLHQLNNGFGAYLTTFWYRPDDAAFSFFAGGLYGLPLLLIVVLLMLHDPVWRADA